MYYLLSIVCGVFIASMIVFNGSLTSCYGVYSAAVLIHLIGLIPLSIIMAIKHIKIRLPKGLPFYYMLGGTIGVATTVFNNISFGVISISAILALSLLGQSITSILIDQYGWLGMEKRPFNQKKIIGLIFVLIGIVLLISLS